jgi:uncharacterized protein
MSKVYAKIIESISAELLRNNPDINKLKYILLNDLGISSRNFKKHLSSIVLQINNEIFPLINNMELILTNRCNLACRYCFEAGSAHTKTLADMPKSTIIKALDMFVDYSRGSNELSLTLFGGEPTLSFKNIKLAVEYIEQKLVNSGKKINFDMTSNGVLLSQEMIEYFSHHNIKVLLSIDGLKSSHDRYRIKRNNHGSYDAVMKNLPLLKKKQPWVGTKMTVMPSEIPYLTDNVKGLYNQGINHFLVGYATGAVWSDQQIHAYEKQINKLRDWYKSAKKPDLQIAEFDEEINDKPYYGCRAAKNTISVATNGKIYGCSRISTLGKIPAAGILGNTQYGLYKINNRLKMVSCNILKENCVLAGIADSYQGGCFASNFEDNHDLYKPNIINHKFSQLVEKLKI